MMGFSDYVLNGAVHGSAGRLLQEMRWDPGLLRPFLIYKDGRNIPCATINVGRDPNTGKPLLKTYTVRALQDRGINSPTFNATSLRKEEWIELDRVLLREARFRLRAYADIAAANSFGGFNGMAKTILEHEVASDPGEAVVDIDGLTQGRGDAPQYQLRGLPLPITHSDFSFSSRKLAESRNSGTPLDTQLGEAAGRRVAESIEKQTIGVDTGITYGGASTMQGGYDITSQVYGFLTYPDRLTNNLLYKPTLNGRSGSGWVPADTLKDVLKMRDALYLNKFYGPFMIYHSNDWDQYMDNDYFLTSTATNTPISTLTLRERLKTIEGIMDVKRLDFLTATVTAANDPARVLTANPFTLIMVQMSQDVVRAVNGMDITTLQWERKGGLELNFKVMAIQVPQVRSTFLHNCGIQVGVATQ